MLATWLDVAELDAFIAAWFKLLTAESAAALIPLTDEPAASPTLLARFDDVYCKDDLAEFA